MNAILNASVGQTVPIESSRMVKVTISLAFFGPVTDADGV